MQKFRYSKSLHTQPWKTNPLKNETNDFVIVKCLFLANFSGTMALGANLNEPCRQLLAKMELPGKYNR